MISSKLKDYLQDPFLRSLYTDVRKAGSLRSISLDLTHNCNLRCSGCYYFAEEMDRFESPEDDAIFDEFIQKEKERGTNFVTIVGGEPSLELGRLKKIYDNFAMNVATNGLVKIPRHGFEKMPIGVAVWGDHETDKQLRGGGKHDIFSKALQNYRGDDRAFFYYTVIPGKAHEIAGVVEQCVDNGNPVLFNFYGAVSGSGDSLYFGDGFAAARREIDRMIERYPDRILMTSYFSRVASTGRLFDEKWGYDVCTSITSDHAMNRVRIQNGKPFNPHFRAYNADFVTTRRCCTGMERDCATCFDVWEHFSWVMLNLKKHLVSRQAFTNWLTTMYLFYLLNRIVDYETGLQRLPQIHARVGLLAEHLVCPASVAA